MFTLQTHSELLLDSMQDNDSNVEDLIGGLIKVKDYDFGPISISLPKLLKLLKVKFGNT